MPLPSPTAIRDASESHRKAQSRLTTQVALRAPFTGPSQLIADDHQTDVRSPTILRIGAIRDDVPSPRGAPLALERARRFARMGSPAADHGGQEAGPARSRRTGTRVDTPDSYERFGFFFAAAEQAALRGFVPNLIRRQVVVRLERLECLAG